jgi:hypothetical protein
MDDMRFVKYAVPALLAVGLLAGLALTRAADDPKPKYTIKEVMQKAHKDDPDKDVVSIFTKVQKGKASDDEKKQLVELYTALGQNKPPKGDADAWKAKTDALLVAAKEVVDGKDAGVVDLKKAADCGACHSVHKGK